VFDSVAPLAQRPGEVELGLWFHDAVYRTWKKDNELRSAQWAKEFLTACGAPGEVGARMHALVMATCHVSDELHGDAALIVDIDLSILGEPPEIYDAFERNVRKEYWWVPRRRFAAARSSVLRSFLSRPTIYHWPLLRERYEAPARANLERALAALAVAEK